MVLFVVFLWPKIKLVPLMTSPIEFPMRLCELEKLSSRAIFNRIKNGVAAERQFCCQNKKIWLCYFIKHCKIMQFDFSVVKNYSLMFEKCYSEQVDSKTVLFKQRKANYVRKK